MHFLSRLKLSILIVLACLALQSCTHHPSHGPEGPDEYIITIPLPDDVTAPRAPGSTKVYLARRWEVPPLARRVTNRLRREFGFRVTDTWPLPSIGEFCIVVRFSDESLMDRIGEDDDVLSVQKINQFAAMRTTPPYNDARLGAQLGNQIESLNRLHAWSTGKDVRIAIIDTPVDLRHPDLKSRIKSQAVFFDGRRKAEDFVHGTAIAGIIGAVANNGIGVVGYAPDAALRSYAACRYRDESRQSLCNTFSLAKAIAAATHDGADIVNLSLAGPEDKLLRRLILALQRAGTVVIASDNTADENARFPASMPGVIAAGPLDSVNTWRPDLISVEDEHLTTRTGGSYQFYHGSSMSAALVTALASLLLEQSPGLSSEAVHRSLSNIQQNCTASHTDAECKMKFALQRNVDSPGPAALR